MGDAGMLAAATGLVMTTYTGVLIGAKAIPAWNRHARSRRSISPHPASGRRCRCSNCSDTMTTR
jgi:hypothetical protein